MVLNEQEIKSRNLILNSSNEYFRVGSYDLTVKEVIDMKCNKVDKFTIPPQGMAYVVFNEIINLPPDIIGFAHVKTSLTKVGIMATNIGIIDPNYKGYISTLLINFGKNDHFINKGDSALRVTFSMISTSKPEIVSKDEDVPDYEKYVVNLQKNIVNLDEKFLNLNSIEKEVEKNVKSSVFSNIRNFVGAFTAGSFLIACVFQFLNLSRQDLKNSIERYDIQLQTELEKNKLLQQKMEVFESNFD